MLRNFRVLCAVLVIALFTSNCGNGGQETSNQADFAPFISGFSSGIISKNDDIRIRLTSPYSGEIDLTKPIDQKLFDFSPNIKGNAYWLDKQTIVFKPDEPLDSEVEYEAEFYLKKVQDVADELATFKFKIQTVKEDFSVFQIGLNSYENGDGKIQSYSGKVNTSDDVDVKRINEFLIAKVQGKQFHVNWNILGSRILEFKIDSIERQNNTTHLELEFNGDAIGVDRDVKQNIEIPAIGDFKVVDVRVNQRPEQFVEIRFSDPIKKQDLKGLIQIEGVYNAKYLIDGNVVKIYPPKRYSGNKKITINPGIQSALGSLLEKVSNKVVMFEQIKPRIRLSTKGVIIPNTEGLIFPFESVGLKAVDIFVSEIFENNIVQFFHNNDFEGNYLRNVGREVVRKRIHLKKLTTKNLYEWNKFYVNLADFMEVNPGSIYRIELRFKKEHALYSCDDQQENQLTQSIEEKIDGWSEHDSYWDGFKYDWNERDNPCHDTYYRHNVGTVSHNFMASDIGVIAKIGNDKTIHIFTTDLVTTSVIKGAEIELYDYQNQLIKKGTSNHEGTAELKTDRKPFLAVVKHNNQYGYLKLEDGYAQSTSKFDASGQTIRDGIKGKIYGERGVWRPGDSLYLTFVLEDKLKALPENHPVIFELKNPNGQLVQRMVRTSHVNGFYNFSTKTAREAPTGNYQAIVTVGNSVFYKTLKVETVKPNRLKIYFNFDKKILGPEDDLTTNMTVKWLHGAIAKNLKAKVDLTIQALNISFPKHPGFRFSDESREFNNDRYTIFEGNLNEEGLAEINPEFGNIEGTPGIVSASFNSKIFEPGGNFSVDRYSIKYSPYKSLVGLKLPKGNLWGGALETGSDHEVDVVVVDVDGKLVNRKEVEAELYKISWRWWWDSYDNSVVNFLSRSGTRKIKTEKVKLNQGKGTFSFNVNNEDYGRFILRIKDPESGHYTSQVFYVDQPYWMRSNRVNNENATMLAFSADKEKYTTGEQVKLSFPSPEGGRALICIENGSKILRKYWVETTKGETKFQFPIEESMSPNVYCHVTLLQPHDNTNNDQPIRLFGILPILVENPETKLNPQIVCADLWRPETKQLVKVSEKNGKPMTYTLAVVDEGLLDLTRFKTPELWSYFYSKEALGVRTWDLFDFVVGAYGGELDKLLSIGGDGTGKDGKNKKKANRFKPMVRFYGPFTTSGSENEHEIDIPNYVGSVRVMVVAGEMGAYGSAEKAVPVRKPLMVLGTLPRVLGPSETVKLPVNVFAMEKGVERVKVKVNTNEYLKLTGETTQKLRFTKPGDEVIEFDLKVADKLGIAKVKIEVSSGKHKAHHEIELDIRTPNPEISQVLDTLLTEGRSISFDQEFFGIKGTNSATLEFSVMPPINLNNRLRYLIRYPHGCVEQTTSSVFPQIHLSRLLELSADKKIEIEENIKAGINRLFTFQNSDGGLGYWPGGSSNSWGTNYAGHFLLEAEKNGYHLPIGMKDKWVEYQRNQARNYNVSSKSYYEYDDLIQAYRLYTLALAGYPEFGAMNKLKAKSELSNQAAWRLAFAYALAGQKQVGVSMIDNLEYYIDSYRDLSYSYGSHERDEAMIMQTLIALDKQSDAIKLSKKVAGYLSSRNWMSTQSTAYCLLAMADFVGNNPSKEINADFTFGGEREGLNTAIPVYSESISDEKIKKIEGKVTNTGKGKLFVRLTNTGIPVETNEVSKSEGIKLEVSYEDMNGKAIDPVSMDQATDFVAVVNIYNPGVRGNLREMSLTQIFPSGWEIINDRMEAGGSNLNGDRPDYMDVRDDRVYQYFNIRRGQRKKFKVLLNATYKGRFYLPAVKCDAMYDNSIEAIVPGKWVEVK